MRVKIAWFGNKQRSTKGKQVKAILFRACCDKGVNYHHLGFGTDSKASIGVGKLFRGKTEACKPALMFRLWSTTASLPNFSPGFQLGTNQRRPNMLP